MNIHYADKLNEFFRSNVAWKQGDVLRVKDREPQWRWVVLKGGNIVSFSSKKKAVEFAEKWIAVQSVQPREWARLNR